MAVGLVLPEIDGTDRASVATTAESLGYESVWIGELWGENAVVDLSVVAHETSELRLGTGIVNVYSRTPAVLAMTANSLARLSDGRFRLGVGVSTPTAIEGLHGMAFERPIRRTHEAVELVRALTGDGRVDYDGELFSVEDVPALDAHVPVFNAALGPANRRLTGRLCDGWMPNNVPISRLDSAFERVADAAREAGREPDRITVAPWIHVAVADDPDRAREAVRGSIAYYVGSGPGYERAVGSAHPAVATEIAERWRAGDRDGARAAVTDEVVEDLSCAGGPESAREKLHELLDDSVVDLPIVSIPDGLDGADVERTIEAVAPSRL